MTLCIIALWEKGLGIEKKMVGLFMIVVLVAFRKLCKNIVFEMNSVKYSK